MSTKDRVRRHRERLRAQGLRPIQLWVPDVTWPGFSHEAHRQSAAVAASAHDADDQAFVDSLSADWHDDCHVRRGEIWTATGPGYAGKPRPVVIVQDDRFDATGSIIVCPLTTNPTEAPLFRPVVEPTRHNGLTAASRLMVDKLTAAPRDRVRQQLGTLEAEHLLAMERSIIVFLGMAD